LVMMSIDGMTDLTLERSRTRSLTDHKVDEDFLIEMLQAKRSQRKAGEDQIELGIMRFDAKAGINGASDGASLGSNRSSSSVSSSALSSRLPSARSEATRLRRRSDPRSPDTGRWCRATLTSTAISQTVRRWSKKTRLQLIVAM
jgi:hypothetical protein